MSIRVEEREDRTIIFFRTRTLDHASTVDLAPDPDSLRIRDRKVGLELRPLQFVRPFGLVYLFWYIRWLLNRGASRVDVVLDGSNPDICNYLKRMKLPDVFAEDEPVTIYPIQKLQLRESDFTDSLVELRTCRVDHDDAVEEQARRVMMVLSAQRPDLEPRREPLHLALSELLNNIHVHSGTREATLAVQAYTDSVYVALGDGGRGIPAALAGHVDADSDVGYVERALEAGVTSRPGGGGWGLTMLADEVREGGGHMAVRSGRGQVVVRREGQDSQSLPRALPGTLVEVALPC